MSKKRLQLILINWTHMKFLVQIRETYVLCNFFWSVECLIFLVWYSCNNWREGTIRAVQKIWIFSLGISQLAQCGQLGDLPELPAPDEQRLQKAAALLQQRLVLRQWLIKYNLQHYYPRLLNLEVTSLEDVYWLEDTKAKSILQKDFAKWSAARQSLPISKQRLETLKADLWSEVVKSSSHQDAWTWGPWCCSPLKRTNRCRYRRHVGRFCFGCRFGDVSSNDSTVFGSRSQAFAPPVCHGKVSSAVELQGGLSLVRSPSRRSYGLLHCAILPT